MMRLWARSIREGSSTFPFSVLPASNLQHQESEELRQRKDMTHSGLTDQEHSFERFLVSFEDSTGSKDCPTQSGGF